VLLVYVLTQHKYNLAFTPRKCKQRGINRIDFWAVFLFLNDVSVRIFLTWLSAFLHIEKFNILFARMCCVLCKF
jgi:hypothetical protein